MGLLFYLWSTVLVFSVSVTGLSIRDLAVKGISFSETLIVRGIVCLAIVCVWALWKKISLVPKSISTQLIRAVIAGLALTFFSMSYNWLSASTIAVISNVDVPLLVILGSLVGQSSTSQSKYLSGFSILILIFYSIGIQDSPRWVVGLLTLLSGLFLLCFGYSFIKKSMAEENEAITVLTPSIALIVYGVAQGFIEATPVSSWDGSSGWSAVASGVGMFGAYYATMKLYDLADIATAEFPTLIASLLIQPVEAILFKEVFSVRHFLLSLAFVVCVYFILTQGKEEYAK